MSPITSRSPLSLLRSLPPAPPATPRLGHRPSPSVCTFPVSPADRHVLRSAPRSPRCAEVAGGTAAGFAALCCCFPCGILSFLFLATVRLPAGLFQRAIRRRKILRKRRARAALHRRRASEEGLPIGSLGLGGAAAVLFAGGRAAAAASAEVVPTEEMREMEKEMLDHFHGTGFWRSPSQRA